MNQADREQEQLINEYIREMESKSYEERRKAAREKRQEAINHIIDSKRRELFLEAKKEGRRVAKIFSDFVDNRMEKGITFTAEEQRLLEELKNVDVVEFWENKFSLITINDNGGESAKTYDYDSLSEPMKKLVSRYKNYTLFSKIGEIKSSLVKVSSEECYDYISDTFDKWTTDFQKMSRNTPPELVDDIIYNIDTFKESKDKDGNPVYEGNINGKKVTFAEDDEIYDALDKIVPSYRFDGLGFGGDNPDAVDFSKPELVIHKAPTTIPMEGPLKEMGAKPIQARSKDVAYMYAQPTETISIGQSVKNNSKKTEENTIKVEGATPIAITQAGRKTLNNANHERLNEQQDPEEVTFQPEETVAKKRKTAEDYEEERKKTREEIKEEKGERTWQARKKYLLAKDQSRFNFAPIAYLRYKSRTVKDSIGLHLKESLSLGKISTKEKTNSMWRRSWLNQLLGERKERKRVQGELRERAISEANSEADMSNSDLDADTQKKVSDDADTQKIVSDDVDTQKKVSDDADTQKIVSDDADTQKKVSDDADTQKKVSDDADTQKKVSDDADTQKKVSDDADTQKKVSDDADVVKSNFVSPAPQAVNNNNYSKLVDYALKSIGEKDLKGEELEKELQTVGLELQDMLNYYEHQHSIERAKWENSMKTDMIRKINSANDEKERKRLIGIYEQTTGNKISDLELKENVALPVNEELFRLKETEIQQQINMNIKKQKLQNAINREIALSNLSIRYPMLAANPDILRKINEENDDKFNITLQDVANYLKPINGEDTDKERQEFIHLVANADANDISTLLGGTEGYESNRYGVTMDDIRNYQTNNAIGSDDITKSGRRK